MAEDSNIHVIPYIDGMSQDTREKFQPPSKARYILNGIIETLQGDNPSISNELGNILCGTIKPGYTIIGARQLDGDDIVVFSTNSITSEIGIFNPNTCTYTETISSDCLNFYLDKRIKIEFRILKGCEKVLYFTDGVNPYRVLNLDALDDYLVNGVLDCSKLELSRPLHYPCISNIDIQDFGGALRIGTYKFRIRLLDSNLNPTNWYHLTPPAPIYKDSLSNKYSSIQGGVNLIDSQYVDGATPISSKSIDLTITNLDTSFSYYQIAVIACTEATGIANEAYILKYRPITNTTAEFNFPGPNPLTDIESDISSLTVDPGIIDVVEAHAQIDSRLVLGGLSNTAYDYGAIQRAANSIKVEYEFSPQQYGKISTGSAKSPKAYLQFRSFMRDEVYAFAIVGKHKKGWASAAFHINGRAPITDPQLINLGNNNPHYRNKVTSIQWDTQLLTVIPNGIKPTGPQVNLADVEHLSLSIGDTVPRWKVYNTAIQYSNLPRGLMGYYECDETYPVVQDCNGKYIYPVGPIDLTTGKPTPIPIRHHRFPDTTLCPIHDSSLTSTDEFIQLDEETDGNKLIPTDQLATYTIYPIGVVFDLTNFLSQLPPDVSQDFEEWEIVVAPRDEFNKTVLDKGYIMSSSYAIAFELPFPDNDVIEKYLPGSPFFPYEPTNKPALYYPKNYALQYANDYFNMFLSPKETFYNKLLPGSHFKNERSYLKELYSIDRINQATPEILDLTQRPGTLPNFDYSWQYKNRLIEDQVFIDSTRPLDDIFSVFDKINNITNLNFLYTKNVLVNRTKDPLISNLKFATSQTVPFNPNPKYANGISYASIKVDRSVYGSLSSLTYRPMNACWSKFKEKSSKPQLGGASPYKATFSGDIHIAKLSHRILSTAPAEGFLLPTVDHNGTIGVSDVSDDLFFSAFYESEINSELRYEGITEDKKFLRREIGETTVSQFLTFLYPHDSTQDGNPETFNKEYFGYNKDFSVISDEVLAFPLPATYDYCSKCDNRYPFRIRYSEKSFQEQVLDKYRVFLPGNYRDLPGETLRITNLFVDKDELMAHTPKALYFIPTHPQTLSTNENSVFLGTGDVLAIPPKRLTSTTYAYGGSSDAFATKTTEFGTFFVDDLSGKVFLFSKGLEEISEYGMRNFFENNLPLSLNAYYKTNIGSSYPILSPTHPWGIGYTATFDTRLRRYILSKRDYYPITIDGVTPIYNDIKQQWEVYHNTKTQSQFDVVNFSDSKWFENRSFTISYHPVHKTWVSFHSYLPDFMFMTESDFFTTNSNGIFKHNATNYQQYYDQKADFIVDMIANPHPNSSVTFGPITLIADTYDAGLNLYDSTFNKLVFYSSDSSTGLQTLLPQTNFSSVEYNPTRTHYARKGREFNINEMKNIVSIDGPVFSSNWADIAPDFPIDKVPSSTSYTKNPFDISRITDEFLGIRLYFNPADNLAIHLDQVHAAYKPFIR